MDGEDLLDDEVLEIELEQRQLDLDRKKLELRKRRAKLRGQLDLTFDDTHSQAKQEPSEGDDALQELSLPGTQVVPQRKSDVRAFMTADTWSLSQIQTPVTQQHLAELNNDGPEFSREYPINYSSQVSHQLTAN